MGCTGRGGATGSPHAAAIDHVRDNRAVSVAKADGCIGVGSGSSRSASCLYVNSVGDDPQNARRGELLIEHVGGANVDRMASRTEVSGKSRHPHVGHLR